MAELRFGLSAPALCSYLPEQQEQLVFLLPEQPLTMALYQQLLQVNFRRSGEQVYTPHCPTCRACQSVRLNPDTFRPSRSQRRLLHKAGRNGWQFQLNSVIAVDEYYPLFADYICHKHADGSMYPPDPEHLRSMLTCSWLTVHCLELYYNEQRVAVCVVDETSDAFSAVYTFFHPSVSRFSPGSLAILYLLQIARQQQKKWLYLGYQIDDCQKMAYKQTFGPQQRFIAGEWHSFG